MQGASLAFGIRVSASAATPRKQQTKIVLQHTLSGRQVRPRAPPVLRQQRQLCSLFLSSGEKSGCETTPPSPKPQPTVMLSSLKGMAGVVHARDEADQR